MRKPLRLLSALLACLLLAGCTSSMPVVTSDENGTLPPVQTAREAPLGDAQQEATQAVALYLPNLSGTRLIAQYERLSLPMARHPAETVVRRLLASTGTADALPLASGVTLQLAPGSTVEVSGGVATVNLAASAVRLSHAELYTVSQAIANTLSQWGDIQSVNVLVSGVQPGLDVAATMPAGCFARAYDQDVGTLYERAAAQKAQVGEDASQKRFSAVAALYFPAQGGKGVLCEARSLSFPGQTQPQIILSLLSVLSSGARSFTGVPTLPDLPSRLIAEPSVRDIAATGDRVATLHFDATLNTALIDAGVPRSVMMASVVTTLCTFVPGLHGVEVVIGDERVTEIVPAGIYEGAGEAISFEGGIARRGDFGRFLLSHCTLYFANDAGRLARVLRPVPCYQAQNARYLLNQLLLGPQPYDSVTGLRAALPSGLSDIDLLGVSIAGDTMLLNLSDGFAQACVGLAPERERLLVYSVVNTMTALRSVKRVMLFVAGMQPDTLAGEIYLPGEFMENVGIVAD